MGNLYLQLKTQMAFFHYIYSSTDITQFGVRAHELNRNTDILHVGLNTPNVNNPAVVCSLQFGNRFRALISIHVHEL